MRLLLLFLLLASPAFAVPTQIYTDTGTLASAQTTTGVSAFAYCVPNNTRAIWFSVEISGGIPTVSVERLVDGALSTGVAVVDGTGNTQMTTSRAFRVDNPTGCFQANYTSGTGTLTVTYSVAR